MENKFLTNTKLTLLLLLLERGNKEKFTYLISAAVWRSEHHIASHVRAVESHHWRKAPCGRRSAPPSPRFAIRLWLHVKSAPRKRCWRCLRLPTPLRQETPPIEIYSRNILSNSLLHPLHHPPPPTPPHPTIILIYKKGRESGCSQVLWWWTGDDSHGAFIPQVLRTLEFVSLMHMWGK